MGDVPEGRQDLRETENKDSGPGDRDAGGRKEAVEGHREVLPTAADGGEGVFEPCGEGERNVERL